MVSDHDAFRRSGGAGSVGYIGSVFFIKNERRGGGGVGRNNRPIHIQLYDASALYLQPLKQRRLCQQHRRARIRQHEGEPLARIVGVERQIGAARLEDAEKPNQQLQRALQAQAHHALRPHPERAQMARQLARARIELAITQPLILEHRRDRIRRLGNLRRKQLRQARSRHRPRRVVPMLQDPMPLLSRENIDAANRPIGSANRRRQQPDQPLRQRLHCAAIKQIAGIFQAAQ